MNVAVFLLLGLVGCRADQGRIIGGNDAESGQFPYQISLRKDGTHICGGSILNEKIILTAAHCVQGHNSEVLTIVAGSTKLNQGGTTHRLTTYDIHESYNPFKIHNDIAVIKLKDPIVYSNNIKPVQIRTDEVKSGETCILSGWGLDKYPGSTPNHLQYINFKTIDIQTCDELETKKDIIDSQVCTLSELGKGSCQGDSGGPLVDTQGRQIGIVSFGTPCARGKPDVFTKVPAFLDWIRRYHKF